MDEFLDKENLDLLSIWAGSLVCDCALAAGHFPSRPELLSSERIDDWYLRLPHCVDVTRAFEI